MDVIYWMFDLICKIIYIYKKPEQNVVRNARGLSNANYDRNGYFLGKEVKASEKKERNWYSGILTQSVIRFLLTFSPTQWPFQVATQLASYLVQIALKPHFRWDDKNSVSWHEERTYARKVGRRFGGLTTVVRAVAAKTQSHVLHPSETYLLLTTLFYNSSLVVSSSL